MLGFKESASRRATWSYRVIEFVDLDGEPWFAIHEVHFQDGKPAAYSENPAAVCSETPEGMQWCLDRMRKALALPALRERDFEDSASARIDHAMGSTDFAAIRQFMLNRTTASGKPNPWTWGVLKGDPDVPTEAELERTAERLLGLAADDFAESGGRRSCGSAETGGFKALVYKNRAVLLFDKREWPKEAEKETR